MPFISWPWSYVQYAVWQPSLCQENVWCQLTVSRKLAQILAATILNLTEAKHRRKRHLCLVHIIARWRQANGDQISDKGTKLSEATTVGHMERAEWAQSKGKLHEFTFYWVFIYSMYRRTICLTKFAYPGNAMQRRVYMMWCLAGFLFFFVALLVGANTCRPHKNKSFIMSKRFWSQVGESTNVYLIQQVHILES